MMTPPISYTGVGTGYYATRLVGNPIADGMMPFLNLTAYIDILPEPNVLKQRKLFQKQGLQIVSDDTSLDPAKGIPVFTSLPLWMAHHAPDFKNTLVDIALRSSQAPQAVMDYIDAGVKSFILPKPFTFDPVQLEEVLNAVSKQQVNAAVASNWHYSEITEHAREALSRAKQQGYKVLRAHISYSKKIKTPRNAPTHDELPHALQIAASTQLLDFDRDTPALTIAEPLKIGLVYKASKHDNAPVTIHSFTDTPFSTPSERERTLSIYLDDGDDEADIIANYDVLFDKNGNLLGPGTVTVDTPHQRGKTAFAENTIVLMYKKIAEAVQMSFQEFQGNPSVLTLSRYQSLIRQIITIHQQWSNAVKAKQ